MEIISHHLDPKTQADVIAGSESSSQLFQHHQDYRISCKYVSQVTRGVNTVQAFHYYRKLTVAFE